MSESDLNSTYDFRNHSRAPVQIESQLLDWQSRSSRLISQKWQNLCGVRPDWKFPIPKIEECRTTQLPQHAVVYEVHVNDNAPPTLLTIPGEFGIAIVKTTLGQVVEELEEVRSVTQIEIALLEMFARETIDAISTSGSGAGFPSCVLGEHIEHPDLVRIYPNESKLIALQFETEFSFGTGLLKWIWPESLADDLFFDDEFAPAEAMHAKDLRNLAMRMRVQLHVQLGTIHLEISDLSKLNIGDILTLDQAIDEPLSVRLSNQTIMRAWPTRTGSFQSMQVEEWEQPLHSPNE